MEDSSNRPPMRQVSHMGVNKLGKNIKKSPVHQTVFASAARDQPPPQVYNIDKSDFRNIVQQLTGSPMREPPLRPTQISPKPRNDRLQRIRPPPLAPTVRPQVPVHNPLPISAPTQQPMAPLPYTNNVGVPHPPSRFVQSSQFPSTPRDIWANTAESPVTAYARYLQNSIIDSGPWQSQAQPHPGMRSQVEGQNVPQHHIRPNMVMPPFPSPRVNGHHPNLPSPRMNVPSNIPHSPRMNGPLPGLPPPWMSGNPPPLLSPTSQFLLLSPTGFLNLLSPRSPYPLLSPGYQFPPPLSPNFSFSSVPNSGFLGPGSPLPPSPGYGLPFSPSFFPASSPRLRDT